MLPGIFGSSVAQVSLLLDTQIASFLIGGSVSWLYFADRLMEFPLGVFSIALATVILPGLSRHHADESPEHFTEHARLGAAARDPAGVARGRGHAGVRRSADRDHLRLRQVRRARRADGELRADGLLVGPARLQPREGARARLLRAPGHADAGARRPDRARLQHGAERRRGAAGSLLRLPVSAHPARHLDLRVRGDQHHAAVARAGASAGVYKPQAGLGRAARAHPVRQRGRWPRCCSGWAATSPSWLAAAAARSAPLRLAVCIVAAAALYFAVLFVCGHALAPHAQRPAHNRHGIHPWIAGPEAPVIAAPPSRSAASMASTSGTAR